MSTDQDYSLENKDDLIGLSEEERKALQGSEEDEKLLARIAGDNDDGDGDNDEQQVNDKGVEKVDSAVGEEAESKFIPQYVAPPVHDYVENIKVLNQQKSAAWKKVLDGELTPDEYAVIEDDVLAKRDALRDQNLKAQISQEQARQSGEQQWAWEVNRFLRDTLQKEGIDYADSNRLNSAFDEILKTLATNPENTNKSAEWFLERAHAQVKASTDQSIQRIIAAQAGPVTAKNTTTAKAARKPDLSQVPATLAGVPVASNVDIGQDEFAHLDKLSGLEIERALAKMSPEQQQRYLETS